jgi:hypothetical protein
MVAGMVRVNVVSNAAEVKLRKRRGTMRAMGRCLIALPVALAAAVGGCASLACAPVTIVVAAKDERPRLLSEPRGPRTDERGRLKEQRREVIVPEYWVQDREGRWYRVGEAEWRAAERGSRWRSVVS